MLTGQYMEERSTAKRGTAGVLAGLALLLCGSLQAATCEDLEGSIVVSQESNPVYLGFFGSALAADSIMNPLGDYGSPVSTLSVRNGFGRYGNGSGIFSAWNPFSLAPPIIYKNLTPIALLTTNTDLSSGISLEDIDADCSFTSLFPSQTPPLPPESFSATDGTFQDRVDLEWTAVSDALFYNIYVSDTPDAPRTFLGQTNMTTARIRGTAPGVAQTFWVFPENTYGEGPVGAFDTGFVSGLATPSAPTAVAASDGTFADRIRVTWADVAGETSYRLFRCETGEEDSCGDPIFFPLSNTTSFDDFDVPADGLLAFYRMKSCNQNGCSAFSAANSGYRQVPVPRQPAAVSASDGIYQDRVAVSWSDVSGSTSYEVYRCASLSLDSCGDAISTLSASTNRFDDFGADDHGTICFYRIKACKGSVCSAFSEADAGNIGLPAAGSVIMSDGFE